MVTRSGPGITPAHPSHIDATSTALSVPNVADRPPGISLRHALCRRHRRIVTVLHVGAYREGELDAIAAAGGVATAYCGAQRMPRRPPFPDGAVICEECKRLRMQDPLATRQAAE